MIKGYTYLQMSNMAFCGKLVNGTSPLRLGGKSLFLPLLERVMPNLKVFLSSGCNNTELSQRATCLAQTLSADKKEMEEFLTTNSFILSVNVKKFNHCTRLFGKYGITAKDVQTYPDVFKCSVAKLRNRFEELNKLNINMSLSLVTVSDNKYVFRLSKLMNESRLEQEYENHEVLLMKLLGCSLHEAEELISKHSWLTNSRIATLKSNIELLKSYGVCGKILKNRLYILVMPKHLLEQQLMTLREHRVLFVDNPNNSFLTFLQPQNSKFEKSLKSFLRDREILQEIGCDSKQDYILSRLNGTTAELKTMLRQFPKLLSVNVPKLKRNLDFLQGTCAFDSRIIIENVLVLAFATNTLQIKYEELQVAGVPQISPAHLKMNQRQLKKVIHQFTEH